MREKSLDRKLRAIRADANSKEFIIADAKDADMGFGIGAPGLSPEAHPGETRFRTLKQYRDIIREVVRQELVDIMLMSASTNELLTIGERIFDASPITPAARANDSTDIHVVRGGRYISDPAQPFRSATLDHIQCGHLDCAPEERTLGADLGLYSVTFTNHTANDLATLEAFKEFRLEAERKNFRYFFEVFDSNVPDVVPPDQVAGFTNDMIARCLAGVTGKGRPQFLKLVYHGPKAMEELFRFDPSLVIGILGGSAGTTYDAFKLIAEAQKYGAKVALFGRKINGAENQFAFIRFLRLIVDGVISPEEAVRAYHAVLERLDVAPHRPLEDDLILRTNVMSYGGSGSTTSIPGISPGGAPVATTLARSANSGNGSAAPASECACRKNGPVPAAASEATACTCAPKKPLITESASLAPTALPILSIGTNGSSDAPPSFATMTSEQRLAYDRARIARLLGEG